MITGASPPCGVAVYRGHLYWANKLLAGSIGRANLNGTGERTLISGGMQACGIALVRDAGYPSGQAI